MVLMAARQHTRPWGHSLILLRTRTDVLNPLSLCASSRAMGIVVITPIWGGSGQHEVNCPRPAEASAWGEAESTAFSAVTTIAINQIGRRGGGGDKVGPYPGGITVSLGS